MSSLSSDDSSMILETLDAMRRQQRHYKVRDWSTNQQQHQDPSHRQHQTAGADDDNDSTSRSNSIKAATAVTADAVDIDCRYKMIVWCRQVVTYCGFRLELVEITMNYLDRYCFLCPVARQDRSVYQLVSMTALYTAAKIHGTHCMDPQMISFWSQAGLRVVIWS